MILPAGAFIVFGLLMGFSNMYVEKKKNLEREALIAQYKRVGKEEITDEVLKEAGV
jgi:hypothetical protein